MKTEIGGTFKWSEEQIKAYAAAFREGDAVKIGNEWHEVKRVENTNAISDVAPEDNPYNLNYRPDGEECYKGVAKGFLKSCVDSPFEIITPKDYEVQEGDKLVRLGDTVEQYGQSELTFGKVYEVVRWHEDGELVYKNDMTTALLASYLKEEDSAWGVIPRYENVKEEEVNRVSEIDYSGKFKVGDRVKVVATAFEDSGGAIGKRGIVLSISEANKYFAPYLVEFDSGVNGHFNEAEISLIERVEEKEEEMNERTELVDEVEYSGKFQVNDRVKVKAAAFKASEPDIGKVGVVSHISDFETNAPYRVTFEPFGFEHFNEAELELVQPKEVSPERQAFEYLLSQDKTATRRILAEEIAIWAKVHLEHKDYNDLRRAIEILEKLEGGERD